MNILRLSRNVTIIAFLLSLLFHVSTVFYLFMQKKANSFNNSIEQQQQQLEKIQKKDEWVETKSRASNFGAPVFFKDTPEQKIEQSPEQIVAAPQEDLLDLELEPQVHTNAVLKHNEVVESNNTALQPAQASPTPSVKKRAPRKKRTQTKQSPPQNPFAAPQPNAQKPPLSLAQLTQGFLNHIKDEGKYSVSMLGNKSGLPSAQQMQYERYLQKLEWCVENSFRINRSRSPLMAIKKDVTIHVLLALHQDGTIKQLAVAQPSGNTQLDTYTLFIFQDASSSFPPVPHALNPFSIVCIVPFVTTY